MHCFSQESGAAQMNSGASSDGRATESSLLRYPSPRSKLRPTKISKNLQAAPVLEVSFVLNIFFLIKTYFF